jgi:hypothetical protein
MFSTSARIPSRCATLTLLCLALALGGLGCGARSWQRGASGDGGTAPPDASRPDRFSVDVTVVDQLPPDLAPPPPSGWQELPVGSKGLINDIRGTSDEQVWLAGQQPTAAQAMVWSLEAGSFRPIGGPKTLYPLEGIWGHGAGTSAEVWIIGQRTKQDESALWKLAQDGSWTAQKTPQPILIHLLAIDGSEAGEVFTVGRTGNLGLAFTYSPITRSWSDQRFSDAFQWIEARDVVVAGPGVAYAVGQRSSRLRFWLYKQGVWHLDQGLPGNGRTICVVGKGANHQAFAGGDVLWRREKDDWAELAKPTPAFSGATQMRGNGDVFYVSNGKALWGRYGNDWRQNSLPEGERPRAIWVSQSWLWVASETGRVWRHHIQTF